LRDIEFFDDSRRGSLHSQDIGSNPITIEAFDCVGWVGEVVFMLTALATAELADECELLLEWLINNPIRR